MRRTLLINSLLLFLVSCVEMDDGTIVDDEVGSSTHASLGDPNNAFIAGNKLDGNKIDGNKIDGNKIDGNKIDGNKIDGNKIDGNCIDGVVIDGSTFNGWAISGNGLNGSRVAGLPQNGNGIFQVASPVPPDPTGHTWEINKIYNNAFATWFENNAKSYPDSDEMMKYWARCALHSGGVLRYTYVPADGSPAVTYRWKGAFGLADGLARGTALNGSGVKQQQLWLTSCLLALTNLEAKHNAVSIRTSNFAASTACSQEELWTHRGGGGVFWGDMMTYGKRFSAGQGGMHDMDLGTNIQAGLGRACDFGDCYLVDGTLFIDSLGPFNDTNQTLFTQVDPGASDQCDNVVPSDVSMGAETYHPVKVQTPLFQGFTFNPAQPPVHGSTIGSTNNWTQIKYFLVTPSNMPDPTGTFDAFQAASCGTHLVGGPEPLFNCMAYATGQLNRKLISLRETQVVMMLLRQVPGWELDPDQVIGSPFLATVRYSTNTRAWPSYPILNNLSIAANTNSATVLAPACPVTAPDLGGGGTHQITLTMATGDADLYVKKCRANDPTCTVSTNSWDCRPYLGGLTSETCTMKIGRTDVLRVMARGWASSTGVWVSDTRSCPNNAVARVRTSSANPGSFVIFDYGYYGNFPATANPEMYGSAYFGDASQGDPPIYPSTDNDAMYLGTGLPTLRIAISGVGGAGYTTAHQHADCTGPVAGAFNASNVWVPAKGGNGWCHSSGCRNTTASMCATGVVTSTSRGCSGGSATQYYCVPEDAPQLDAAWWIPGTSPPN